MKRSPGEAGFNARSALVASSRLTDAVAATLAIGALSLCVILTLTVMSIKVSMAMPMPRCDFRPVADLHDHGGDHRPGRAQPCG